MKGKSIVEVSVVFVLLSAFARWRYAQLDRLGVGFEAQRYIAGILMIAIPVAIIWLTRRDWAEYGFTLRNWRYSLQIGLDCYLVKLIPWVGGYGLIVYLGSSHTNMLGALILVVAYCAAIWVVLQVLRRRDPERPYGGLPNILLIAGLLLVPILAGAFTGRLTLPHVSTVVWLFIFTGFGEEILYRGYFQSTINREFGRPWQVMGVSFGPGLIVASLLFAISHVLNTYNPLLGQGDLAWWWGVWTFFSGLFFGLVREKTGSLLSVAIAHGLPNAVGEGLAAVFGWQL
jgi:membrane protease YdiL (CAAX protease family)